VAKIIGVLSSVLSLVSFFYVQEYAGLRWIFLISGVCCTIIILSLDKEKGPIKCSNEEKNIEYMCNWISTDGEVVVFSRNLSWVKDDKVAAVLKSKGNELSICAENDSKLLSEFRKAGVNVYLYGELGFKPVSRFTIIRANKSGKQIAIAQFENRHNKDFRYIYETRNIYPNFQEQCLLEIAKDLFNLVKLTFDKKKKGELHATNS
jgi:hypothetical protein